MGGSSNPRQKEEWSDGFKLIQLRDRFAAAFWQKILMYDNHTLPLSLTISPAYAINSLVLGGGGGVEDLRQNSCIDDKGRDPHQD